MGAAAPASFFSPPRVVVVGAALTVEARKMWRACGLEELRLMLLTCPTPRQLLEALFSLPEDEKLKCILLLWLWWTERNKANHKQTRASVEEFQFLMTRHVAEWRQFCMKPESKQQQVFRKPVWKGTEVDTVKINIDGAFDGSNQLAGWGCIARDHTGDVIFAAAVKLDYMSEALHAEAYALIRGIQLAGNYGMGKVVFETDCLGLVRAMKSKMFDRSPLGVVFRETRFLLQLGISEWSIIHCPRTCNVPAHELAAIGRSGAYGDQHVWLAHLPSVVNVAVAADVVGQP